MPRPRIPYAPADPSPLWNPFKRRYTCVSPTGKGDRFAGQVVIDNVRYHLGSAPIPRGAAALVAGFLLAVYGPQWPALRRSAICEVNRRNVRRRPGKQNRRGSTKPPPGAG